MKENNRAIEQARTIAVIFSVVFIGLLLFFGAVSYYYKAPLSKSSCDLCFELNPDVSHCENFTGTEINNLTLISYGE